MRQYHLTLRSPFAVTEAERFFDVVEPGQGQRCIGSARTVDGVYDIGHEYREHVKPGAALAVIVGLIAIEFDTWISENLIGDAE